MPRKNPEAIDDDVPELTAEDLKRFRPMGEVLPPDFVAMVREHEAKRHRGRQKSPTKTAVSIRLSPDVLAWWKDSGPGWQTRIDMALRKAAKLPRRAAR